MSPTGFWSEGGKSLGIAAEDRVRTRAHILAQLDRGVVTSKKRHKAAKKGPENTPDRTRQTWLRPLSERNFRVIRASYSSRESGQKLAKLRSFHNCDNEHFLFEY